MESLVVRPSRYPAFGAPEGSAFCLVTNTPLLDRFRVAEADGYGRTLTVPYDAGDSFEHLLADGVIPEPAHVLVLSPLTLFRSPAPAAIGRRKLMVMACNSTPTSFEALQYFLDVVERTDPAVQQAFADRFFTRAAAAGSLRFVDHVAGSSATFAHVSDQYEWNQQAGPIEWGDQQLAPAGELSVLPADIMRFDATLRLPIDGEVAFRGQPVLHAGAPSYLREDQARIHSRLSALATHAVVATVERGVITGVHATHDEAAPAATMLEALFEIDSRYRIIWEIGFGINTAFTSSLPGNHAMNEVFGAQNGVVHWGLGLTPYTQYALILASLDTRVVTADGETLAGAPAMRMKRRTTAACGCHA